MEKYDIFSGLGSTKDPLYYPNHLKHLGLKILNNYKFYKDFNTLKSRENDTLLWGLLLTNTAHILPDGRLVLIITDSNKVFLSWLVKVLERNVTNLKFTITSNLPTYEVGETTIVKKIPLVASGANITKQEVYLSNIHRRLFKLWREYYCYKIRTRVVDKKYKCTVKTYKPALRKRVTKKTIQKLTPLGMAIWWQLEMVNGQLGIFPNINPKEKILIEEALVEWWASKPTWIENNLVFNHIDYAKISQAIAYYLGIFRNEETLDTLVTVRPPKNKVVFSKYKK